MFIVYKLKVNAWINLSEYTFGNFIHYDKIYEVVLLYETKLEKVRGLSNQDVQLITSLRRARRSGGTTLEENKQIFFMTVPKI